MPQPEHRTGQQRAERERSDEERQTTESPLPGRFRACSRTGGKVSVDALWQTRRWVEHNVPVKVAPDATRCSLGVASLVKAEIRLSRLHLKDRAAEREAFLARRWPDLPLPAETESIFPAGAAAAVATPNLEFRQ